MNERGGGLKPSYLRRMFNGDVPMNPLALSALHEALGFARHGFDLGIWDSDGAMAKTLASVDDPLLDVLHGPPRHSGLKASLSHAGFATARVGFADGPVRLEAGTHRFDLDCRGASEAWVILLEYDATERNWWSLLGSDAATIGGEPILDTRISGGKVTPVVLQVGRQAGIYELFALVSPKPFEEAIFAMVPATRGREATKAVAHRRLASHLGGRAGFAVARFAYQS